MSNENGNPKNFLEEASRAAYMAQVFLCVASDKNTGEQERLSRNAREDGTSEEAAHLRRFQVWAKKIFGLSNALGFEQVISPDKETPSFLKAKMTQGAKTTTHHDYTEKPKETYQKVVDFIASAYKENRLSKDQALAIIKAGPKLKELNKEPNDALWLKALSRPGSLNITNESDCTHAACRMIKALASQAPDLVAQEMAKNPELFTPLPSPRPMHRGGKDPRTGKPSLGGGVGGRA